MLFFCNVNVPIPFAGGVVEELEGEILVVEVLEGEVLLVEVLEGGVARECKTGATFFLSLHSPKLYFKWKSVNCSILTDSFFLIEMFGENFS